MPYVMPARPPLDTAPAPGPDGTLPALRGLATLADLRPKIAVDTREREPLKFTWLQAVERALFTGDYFDMRSRAQLHRRTQIYRRPGQLLSIQQPGPVRARIASAPRLSVQAAPGRRHTRGYRRRPVPFADCAEIRFGNAGRIRGQVFDSSGFLFIS